MPDTPFLSKLTFPHLLLASLIILYTVYFSWYTLNRHNTLNSYAADLSLIDQPMWNTVIGSGGFMEQTWGSRQQPRLAEHFEPILIPLAFLFYMGRCPHSAYCPNISSGPRRDPRLLDRPASIHPNPTPTDHLPPFFSKSFSITLLGRSCLCRCLSPLTPSSSR